MIKLASIDTTFLTRVLLGSAAAGGGVGLLNSLLRQRNAILEQDEDDEDSVVDLNLPPASKQAGLGASLTDAATGLAGRVNNVLTYLSPKPDAATAQGGEHAAAPGSLSGWDLALGGAAIPLGFLGGLDLTRRAYQGYRRQELKQRLRDDEEAYMQALSDEVRATKRATDDGRQPLSFGTLLAMGMLGMPLLSGVTAGVLTDRFLTHQFPARSRERGNTRIKVDSGEPDEDPNLKQAALCADDLLVHTVLELHKEARDTGVADVIGAVASGRLADMEDMLCKYGADAAFDLAQGQGCNVPQEPLLKCAAVRLAMDSGLGDPLRLMAAAAFATAAPSWRDLGREVNQFPKMARDMTLLGGLDVLLHVHAAAASLPPMDKEAALAGVSSLRNLFQAPDTLQTSSLQAGTQSEANSSTGSQDIADTADIVDQAMTAPVLSQA